MRTTYFINITAILVILFASCEKKDPLDLTTLQSNHHLAIPMVTAEIDVQDMLEADTGDVISTGSAGELFLAYSSPDISISASEILQISDESFNYEVAPAVDAGIGTLPAFSSTANYQDTFSYSFTFPSNEEITSIDFAAGQMSINIQNDLSHSVTVGITIPSLQDGGVPYTKTLIAGANSSAQDLLSFSSALQGTDYSLDFTQGNVGYNEFIVLFDVTITGSGAAIDAADKVNFSFGLSGMEYDVIYGDLKYQEFALDAEELAFDIFSNSFFAIDFRLTNPEIKLDFTNSFGFNALMGMDSMYYEDLSGTFIDNITYDSTATNLAAAPFFFPLINHPSTQGGQMNGVISMNNNNSSIADLIDATPKNMVSKPVVIINPDTTISNSNYILNNSEINVATEVSLPLDGYAGGWVMGDTLPFDFQVDSLFSSNTTIEESVIKFVTTNGWPVEVSFTLELLDSSQQLLTSIANQEMFIESGLLDANGKVTEPTLKVTELYCDSTCVNNLNQSKYVIISVEANTSDYDSQQSVKIYEDYKLGLSMSLLISGRMF